MNSDNNLINIGSHKGFTFIFGNSKTNSGIKFADFVAGILREKYISGNQESHRTFEEYCVNGEISFIKITQ
ncbi:MAG: hypothetical protein Q9M94_07595 [Candidatus Gracilibacteria bacterium]|nr:hypothetical protein [Candidatus Gracilibacteria bacterium]MDQ7023152.1 hypothetical protein [Candidatus Gracilibacteria bacterium]